MAISVEKFEHGSNASDPSGHYSGVSGGSLPGGGGKGGDNPEPEKPGAFEGMEEFSPEKLVVGMWFFLLVVLMTFGGLISAYVVLSVNRELEWRPFDIQPQMWVSSALIILSSFAYGMADKKLRIGQQRAARGFFLATTGLGGVFIASQILAWYLLYRQGIYAFANPYAGLFYALTAVHAVHVVGGIIALGYIVLRTASETSNESELLRRQTISKVAGWYWHFMGVLWIVLFLLLGFWK